MRLVAGFDCAACGRAEAGPIFVHKLQKRFLVCLANFGKKASQPYRLVT
jgi:hypothetical protein